MRWLIKGKDREDYDFCIWSLQSLLNKRQSQNRDVYVLLTRIRVPLVVSQKKKKKRVPLVD